MSRLFSVIVICGVLAACSGGSSPTGPTQPSLPTVPYTLTVRTQVAPPAHTSIPGILYPYVHVAMVDTPSQEWRGGYLSEGEQTMTFTNVIGLAHLVVGRVPEGSARELEVVETEVTMHGDQTVDVLLRPKKEQRQMQISQSIVDGCPASWNVTRFCRTVTLPVYHDGTIAANVTFDAGQSGMTLELWRGTQERLATSTSPSAGRREIASTPVTAGHVYYVRILYDEPRLLFSGSVNATT